MMLTLFRGGTVAWLSPEDAASIGVADNDWLEVCNRNGVLDCRAVVSPRMPARRLLHLPRQGPPRRAAAHGEDGQAGRHAQRAHARRSSSRRTWSAATRSSPTRSTTTAAPAASVTRSWSCAAGPSRR